MAKLICVCAILLVVLFTTNPVALVAQPAVQAFTEADNKVVTTRNQVKVGQRILKYTAQTGRLPIMNNETGEVHGNMFFMSYQLDLLPSEPKRPLMFLWNGGPGANSSLVHLSAFGPKRLKSNDDPTSSSECECEIEDNQMTWLDQADLVFVDPIGTGFSRPTRVEYGHEFYSTLGDIASVAEFVCVYLTRFDYISAK